MIRVYGKKRFADNVIPATQQIIRSFLLIDHQTSNSADLCMNSSQMRCPNKLCLQINSTSVNCLTVDDNVVGKQFIIATGNPMNSTLQNDIQSLVANDVNSQADNPKNKYRYRPRNTILFFIISFTIIAGVS